MHPTVLIQTDKKAKYINYMPRLMSDYEVTLVNDNSELPPYSTILSTKDVANSR
jgi:hypothetical protein